MYSNNPQNDLFNVGISEDFWVPEIVNPYNNLLKQLNYPLQTIQEIIMESIQSVELNGFDIEFGEQQQPTDDGGSTPNSPPSSTSNQNLDTQKIVTINYRHTDGFLSYYCLLQHYFKRHETGYENIYRTPFSALILTTQNVNATIAVDKKFYKVQMKSVPPLVYSYSSIDRQFDTFAIEYKYNRMGVDIHIPTLNIK